MYKKDYKKFLARKEDTGNCTTLKNLDEGLNHFVTLK